MEWQLSWAVPASDTIAFGARAVLSLLYVNPQPEARVQPAAGVLPAPEASSTARQPEMKTTEDPSASSTPAVPLRLPVPWTILLSAAHVQLTVLASASVIPDNVASPVHEAAVVELDRLQVRPEAELCYTLLAARHMEVSRRAKLQLPPGARGQTAAHEP